MTIRTATVDDAQALLHIYSYYVQNTAVTFEYDVPTVEEFAQRIAKTLQKYPWLVAEEDGCIVGYAYAAAFRTRPAYGWGVELSVYLDCHERGRGTGRRLYEALEAMLQRMGVLNLYACIAVPEQEDEYLTFASERFHERMGFVKNGTFHRCGYKFNRWYHMIWMEKLIGDHQPDQPPVKPFDQVAF